MNYCLKQNLNVYLNNNKVEFNALFFIIILSILINSIMAFSVFYEKSFDSYTHMFFADHYRKAWFRFWEPRWYEGFSVTTYPPLSSQCIALMSYLVGLERAYQLLTFILMIVFPIIIYYFSTIFVSRECAIYSSLISVFLPSLIMTKYVFGQLPTIFSLTHLLLSLYFLDRYVDSRSRIYFVLTIVALVASISSHHFTTVFFAPFLLTAYILTCVVRKGLKILRFIIPPLLIAFLISLLIMWPFWEFLLQEGMQKPIFHASRSSILTNEVTFYWFFLYMNGYMLILIPLSILTIWFKKDLIPLMFMGLLLFIIGLGGTTPLPSYFFGRIWEWLTYDRFTLWSHIVLTPLVGWFLNELFKRWSKIFILFFIGMIINAAFICNLSISHYESYLPSRIDISPIVEFLSRDNNWRWRYITLGFGSANFAKLSIYTNATTIDGFYATARRNPILRESGIESIDGAKHWVNGTYVLNIILRNADSFKLRWVFCNDPYYYDILISNGFKLIFSQENTKDGRLKGVTIWAKDAIPQLDDNEIVFEEKITILNYLWGCGPLSSLILMNTLLLKITITKILYFNKSIFRKTV